MPSKIFISYRRDDDPAAAARVRDGLAQRFGKASLFMDVDDLLAGLRFDEELAKALASCDIFIAIIGARWLDLLKAKAAAGERDYVQEEIAGALQRKIVVIPVRVGRDGLLPPLPRGDDLPAGIADLVRYQKHDVTHEYFGRDVAALAESISAVRRKLDPNSARLLRSGTWVWLAAAVAGAMSAGYAGAYLFGLPVPWPAQPASAPAAKSEASSKGQGGVEGLANTVAKPKPDVATKPEATLQPAPPPAARRQIRRSAAGGGKGGEAFDQQYANLQHMPITGLNVTVTRSVADRNQKLIGRLQVQWGDVLGPVHGGGPADVPTPPARFGKDETIQRIIIFHKRFTWPDPNHAPVWVSGLQVRTSKGVYTFGDADGTATTCVPASGEQIIGFFGRAGSYIDQLGCLFSAPMP